MIKPIYPLLQQTQIAFYQPRNSLHCNLRKMARSKLGLFIFGPALCLGVSGCSNDGVGFGKNSTLFDGNYYPTSLKSTRRDRQTILVTVKNAGQGISGARQAAKLASAKHCIKHYGTSDVAWDQPLEDENVSTILREGTLYLTGKCDY